METIKISRLHVNCCHGVRDFEKVQTQPFYITAVLSADLWQAGVSDDLDDTVNYSAVCRLIEQIATQNCYNLIERLAREIAFAILENFSTVQKIAVTVEKPKAPVKQQVETLSVSMEFARERAYLSLGSSMGDKAAYLDFAIKRLGEIRGVSVQKVSDYIATQPYGGVAQNEFLNAAVEISTFLPPQKLLLAVQAIEREAGRVRNLRWEDRTLDIDIVFYGKQIIVSDALIVPHPDYFNRDFVLTPLKQIAPAFVCPVKGVPIAKL